MQSSGLVIDSHAARAVMRAQWDVEIVMDDGVTLRADVYLPIGEGPWPVLLSHGPYAKGLSFQQAYPSAWKVLEDRHAESLAGSSNLFQAWEVVDPERWCQWGYVCVRVDSRGAGRSEGIIDCWSARETVDFAACIEWAGEQEWSSGKVGLSGISYFAINQWQVASLQPKYLAAICAWEGGADFYRDASHHGGIYSSFLANWYDMQVKTVQHGLGDRGPRSVVHGDTVCGPETVSDAELAATRSDFGAEFWNHSVDDGWYAARRPDWSRIQVPLLSSGNWGGQGLHPRGNTEGYVQAASRDKWLEMHGLSHWEHYYSTYGMQLQKDFFDYYLKDVKNGWDSRRRVQLLVRHPDKFVQRSEDEWPIARTEYRSFSLGTLQQLTESAAEEDGALVCDVEGEGLTFMTAPLEAELEITGHPRLDLTISSAGADADVFVVLRVFDPQGVELVFQGALDPHTPVGQGWLRASHRAIDHSRTRPERPYHPHTAASLQPLKAGVPVELEIEIWPTCIVVPKGWRIGLSVRGRDYEWDGPPARLSNLKNPLRGCGPFLHDAPQDVESRKLWGNFKVHVGSLHASKLTLPVIPAKGGG